MKSVLTAGLAAVTFFVAGVWNAEAQTAPDAASRDAARKLATTMCASCHGPEGAGSKPSVPRLAGQQKAYLAAQLKAFRRHNRSDPEGHDYMWGVAATLDDNVVDGLADYFATRPPMKGAAGDAALASKGQDLFERGDSGRDIAACAMCHGQQAEGQSVFPRLAGQYGQYLGRQMQMLRKRLRESQVMHGIVRDLTDDDILALSTYLQGK
ncbi:MAG: c-type cytochrome [Burkholderiales bacterium]